MRIDRLRPGKRELEGLGHAVADRKLGDRMSDLCVRAAWSRLAILGCVTRVGIPSNPISHSATVKKDVNAMKRSRSTVLAALGCTGLVATLLAIFRMKLAMIEASLIAQEHGKLLDLLRPTRDARIAWQKRMEAGKK